jgi:SagB-type dehydrogenase family enzyme
MFDGREQIRLRLSPEVRLVRGEEYMSLTSPRLDIRVPDTPGLATALETMARTATPEQQLCEMVQKTGSGTELIFLYSTLISLEAAGVILRSVLHGSNVLATLVPAGAQPRLPRGPSGSRFRLSPLAYMRFVDGRAIVDSPLGWAHVELTHSDAVRMVIELASARSRDELATLIPGLATAEIEGLLVLLDNAGFIATEKVANARLDAEDCGLDWWDFPDLLFHMRSRVGRHRGGYGATYRRNPKCAPPLVRAASSRTVVPLSRPDLNSRRATEAPFTDVLESRRSIRDYDTEPISLDQLAEFLYRAARIQTVLPSDDVDYALRPSPSGGAIQELELYIGAVECRGLPVGLYRYDAFRHELDLVAQPSELLEKLFEQAWITGDKRSPLQVYIGITARCRRVFWKYESMAYALMLKDVGALYATMYLVATAIGLAPCALGGGNSELFCKVAGLDPLEEPAIGEFLLGARRPT